MTHAEYPGQRAVLLDKLFYWLSSDKSIIISSVQKRELSRLKSQIDRQRLANDKLQEMNGGLQKQVNQLIQQQEKMEQHRRNPRFWKRFWWKKKIPPVKNPSSFRFTFCSPAPFTLLSCQIKSKDVVAALSGLKEKLKMNCRRTPRQKGIGRVLLEWQYFDTSYFYDETPGRQPDCSSPRWLKDNFLPGKGGASSDMGLSPT